MPMVLTDDQVELIADRVRALPSNVLASIGLPYVLGERVEQRGAFVYVPPEHDDAPLPVTEGPRLTEQRFDGETRQVVVQVKKRNGRIVRADGEPKLDTRPVAERVFEYIERHPGCQRAPVLKELGITPAQWTYATRQLVGDGRIAKEGDRADATWYARKAEAA